MPMFERRDGEGVYLDSCQEVFPRGKRINEHSARRIRDVFFYLLHSLGAPYEDIAIIFRLTSRQVRNRLEVFEHLSFANAIRNVVREIAADTVEHLDAERARCEKERAQAELENTRRKGRILTARLE